MSKSTPLPWEYRNGTLISTSVKFEASRTGNGYGGKDTWDYYGGELVCETITESDARFILEAIHKSQRRGKNVIR